MASSIYIVLIAVTFDGNNQLTLLAFAIVDVENADNWLWFKECLENDFAGFNVWMSDADKGIRSNRFTLSMTQTEIVLSRCARHLEHCLSSGRRNENSAISFFFIPYRAKKD